MYGADRLTTPLLRVNSNGEFDKKVNSLAEYLNKQFNNKIIPVLSNDNLDYLITMIACWKINKVYMPINLIRLRRELKALYHVLILKLF